MKYSYAELAKMIDHSLLHPTIDRQGVGGGLRHSRRDTTSRASCIKPYYVRRSAELLRGSSVLVGAVIGFPHGIQHD
jgi:deoxyribose-phosphate aldolase